MSPFFRGFDVPDTPQTSGGSMLPSLIRTYTPLLVAYLVGWLASLGITVDTETQGLITTGIGTVIAAAYYAAVRVLERKWPALSVLLGSSQQPAEYSPDGTASAPPVNVTISAAPMKALIPAADQSAAPKES